MGKLAITVRPVTIANNVRVMAATIVMAGVTVLVTSVVRAVMTVRAKLVGQSPRIREMDSRGTIRRGLTTWTT